MRIILSSLSSIESSLSSIVILIILNWILIILNSELSTLFVRFQVLEPHVLPAQFKNEDNEDNIILIILNWILIILNCDPHYPHFRIEHTFCVVPSQNVWFLAAGVNARCGRYNARNTPAAA